MKKIFRLALVFAVCGGALMFTGCTKDYSEDIASVEKKLSDLQTGTIATQTKQIAELQQTAEALDKTDKSLQSSIDALKAQLTADKAELQKAIESKATSTAIEALQNRVSALESSVNTLTSQMATVQADIKSINETMAKQADLDLVKATYATKAEVTAVISDLATTNATLDKVKSDLEDADEAIKNDVKALQTKLESKTAELDQKDAELKTLIEKEEAARIAADNALTLKYDALIELEKSDIATLKGEIADIKINVSVLQTKVANLEAETGKLQNQIDAVKSTADSALAKANDALTNIGILSEDLHTNYYKKAEIDETVNTLNGKIANLETALNTEKQNRETQDALLQGYIDAEAKVRAEKDELLQGNIDAEKQARIDADDAIIAKYDAAVKNLKDEIARIDENIDEIEASIVTINGQIADLQEADKALDKKISDLDTKLSLQIADAVAKIEAEELARKAAVAEEKEGREAADKALNDAIEEMGKAYKLADEEIKETIEALEKAYKAEDVAIYAKIAANDIVYKAADKALQDNIDALEDKVDEKVKALETEDATLQKEIDALKDELAKEVKAREDLAKSLSTAIATQGKTLTELINNKAEALQKGINENTTAISANKTAIEENATAIAAIQEDLLMKKGDISTINAKITVLQNRADADSIRIDNLQTDLKALAQTVEDNKKELQANIDLVDKALTQEVTDRKEAVEKANQAIQDEVKAREEAITTLAADVKKTTDDLQAQIDDLNNKLKETNETIAKLRAEFEAVKVRVSTISVMPSKTAELNTIEVGDGAKKSSKKVLIATFEVEPAVKASSLTAENITLNYTTALTRAGVLSQATIVKVNADAETGYVQVIAKDIDAVTGGSTACYFSLTYAGKDGAGEYTVTSDYVQAVEDATPKNLNAGLRYTLNGFAGVIKKCDVAKSLDYVAADTVSYIPFAVVDEMPALQNDYPVLEPILGTVALPLAKVAELTGLVFDVDSAQWNAPEALGTVANPIVVTPVTGGGFAGSTVTFEAKHVYDPTWTELKYYISDTPYTFTAWRVVNGYAMTANTASYTITAVQHETVIAKDTVHWNYINYKTGTGLNSRCVTMDVEFPATAVMYPAGKETWIANTFLQFFEDFGDNATYGSLVSAAYTGAYTKENQTVESESAGTWQVKTGSTVTDEYTYKYNVLVEKVFDGFNYNAGEFSQPGSITKPIVYTIPDAAGKFIADNSGVVGSVNPALISGLTGVDTTYAKVLAAFVADFNAHAIYFSLNGTDMSGTITGLMNADGSLTVTIPAGTLNYDTTNYLVLTKTNVFETPLYMDAILKTEAAPFSIKTTAYIVDGIGTVRGALKSGVYGIEDLFYNKQIEAEGLADANEDAAATFTVVFGAENETVAGAIGAVVNTDGAAGLELDKTTNKIADNTKYMTWGTYTGLQQTMTAKIYVNGVEVNGQTPVVYTLKTDVPVQVATVASPSADKLPATDLPIYLTKNWKVYGMENGEYKTATNLVGSDGKFKTTPDYKLAFKIAEPATIEATVNGTSTILTKDVDYTWDAANYAITLVKDNLKGVMTFSIPVEVTYYLDYNTEAAIEKTVTVTVNQK